MISISKDTRNDKAGLLQYFRDRSNEFLAVVNNDYGNTEHKKKAKKLNTLLVKARVTLIEIIDQKARRKNWTNQEILECVLMVMV